MSKTPGTEEGTHTRENSNLKHVETLIQRLAPFLDGVDVIELQKAVARHAEMKQHQKVRMNCIQAQVAQL